MLQGKILSEARLGSARLGSTRLDSARLGSARLGSPRHPSCSVTQVHRALEMPGLQVCADL
jgi:hypothetical protein